MYKVLEIDERMMDRDVIIQNLNTGTTELCFDNSIGYSDDHNFSFMKTDSDYECKILLIGDQQENKNESSLEYLLAEEHVVTIGNGTFIKVLYKDDVYYISADSVTIKETDRYVLFDSFRKDLLQVNDQVSPMYL